MSLHGVHLYPGPMEMLILAIAVLLFGKRLPEVGRSLGKSLVEFKKESAGSKRSSAPRPPPTPRRRQRRISNPTSTYLKLRPQLGPPASQN